MFNTVLLCLSTLILMKLVSSIYGEGGSARMLPFIAAFIYVTFPEILHGMGMTYWHQSVMQVTLLLQVYMYRKRRESVVYRYLFYALCLINPYIEWSGYVANAGFAIAEVFTNGNKKAGVKNGMFIGLVTLASFNLFCAHYMSVVDSGGFFSALRGRFIARNFSVPMPVSFLFNGYLGSFGRHMFYALAAMALAVAIICRGVKWTRGSVLAGHADILFVSLFPVLENFLMKEHAVNYSYDRMKLAFPICLVFCDLCYLAMRNVGKKAVVNVCIIALAAYIGGVNVAGYKGGGYIWDAGYRSGNIALRDYIEQKYGENAVYGFDVAVRGYVSLLYGRGIYEGKDLQGIMGLADEKDCRYGILLLATYDNPKAGWSMNEISNALIYDRYTGRRSHVYVYNGKVNEEENFQFITFEEEGEK